jgi:hypothetical protein
MPRQMATAAGATSGWPAKHSLTSRSAASSIMAGIPPPMEFGGRGGRNYGNVDTRPTVVCSILTGALRYFGVANPEIGGAASAV